MCLSKNFRLWEFVCPCCGRDSISGRLVTALQELRDLADAPITITSGIRCERWNKKCGGAEKSQHLYGRAVDIVIRGLHPVEMETLAEKVTKFRQGGIGVYPNNGFLHVDVRHDGPARWKG